MKTYQEAEQIISRIAQEANKHNDNEWCFECESIIQDALNTLLDEIFEVD